MLGLWTSRAVSVRFSSLRVHICQRLVADYQGTQRAFKRVRRFQAAGLF